MRSRTKVHFRVRIQNWFSRTLCNTGSLSTTKREDITCGLCLRLLAERDSKEVSSA